MLFMQLEDGPRAIRVYATTRPDNEKGHRLEISILSGKEDNLTLVQKATARNSKAAESPGDAVRYISAHLKAVAGSVSNNPDHDAIRGCGLEA
jgi:hypothetical protein